MPRAPQRPIIGIDLGGTNMQIGVVSADGKVLARVKHKTHASEGYAKVVARIIAGIGEACAEAKILPRSISCVGIGAPGAIDASTGVVLEAPNLRWNNAPLGATLRKAFGRPVSVDNDVRSAIFGEHRLGAGRGCTELLGVWIGTGIGGGLILNNQLYRGFSNTAGEIGHVTLFPHMPPGTRSLENNCSRTAIVERMVKLIKTNHASIVPKLAEGDLSDVKARIVAAAYAKRDKVTRTVIEDAALNLGIGIASAVTLLGLQRVVLGGGLTESMGEDLVNLVRQSVHKHAFPAIAKRVEVVKTMLDADAGLLGAAMLAASRAKL
ncbi:ROK family protein [soil metagenome]